MKTTLRLPYSFALLFLAATPFASASLLIDPLAGSSVGFSSNAIDDQVTRSLGGTFSLFGADITRINVASDGFLGTGSDSGLFLDRDLATLAAASQGAVVSALFDHTVLGNGSTVTDQSVANTYYAVTYQSIYGFNDTNPDHTSDYQIVLFMAGTTIGGFEFQAGDIAISYGHLASTPEGSFTVGVAHDTSNFAGTPLSVDGELFDLSTLPSASQFLLYRPQDSPILSAISTRDAPPRGERVVYSVSLESTATPEPVSMALFGIGLMGLAFLGRHRRR